MRELPDKDTLTPVNEEEGNASIPPVRVNQAMVANNVYFVVKAFCDDPNCKATWYRGMSEDQHMTFEQFRASHLATCEAP